MNARRSNDPDDAGARERRSLCQYEMDHPRIDERLDQLELRTDKHDTTFTAVVGEIKLFREEFITHRTKMVTLLAVAASAGSATGVVLGLIVAILALR
jgi:hypothetical protein